MAVDRFTACSEAVLAGASEGLSMREACAKAKVSYNTVRNWMTEGKHNPRSRYAEFVAKLDAARGRSAPGKCAEPAHLDLGPVETQIESMLEGRELNHDGKLAAAQARMLARTADSLSQTKGGAAATALTNVSRRLEEVVGGLALPREDRTDEIRKRMNARRREVFGIDDETTDPHARVRNQPVPVAENGHKVTAAAVAPGKERAW